MASATDGALSSLGLTTGSPLGCQGASDAAVQLIDSGVFRILAPVERGALAEPVAKLRIVVWIKPRVIGENLVAGCSGIFSSDATRKTDQCQSKDRD